VFAIEAELNAINATVEINLAVSEAKQLPVDVKK
jgi:hypothetical protein